MADQETMCSYTAAYLNALWCSATAICVICKQCQIMLSPHAVMFKGSFLWYIG